MQASEGFPVSRWAAAISGVVAAAVAVAVGEVVAVLTGPSGAPLIAVGNQVIVLAPEPMVQFGKEVFGTSDKIALQIGTALLLIPIAVAAGLLARRNFWYAAGILGAFTVVGAVAAAATPGAGVPSVIPSIAAGAAGIATAWWLLRRAPETPTPEDAGTYERRRFLVASGLALGGAGLAGWAGRTFGQGTAVEEARAGIQLPPPASPAPATLAGADLDVPGLTSYLTPNKDFYRIDTALITPRISPEGYTLRIFGRCDNPIELGFDDLLARPLIERDITLCCVSNEVGGGLAGNARWLGVPLKDLLDEVAPHAGADQLVGRSQDGFTAGAPTALCRDGRDAMLAIGMNSEPLPLEHGFPVRMVVPGLYGYVSATKWLTELELTSFADFDAYWIPRGWSTPTPIKTFSRIDTPRSKASTGKVAVAGVAWAQHRGIASVDVRIDGGEWQQARLSDVVSPDTWRQWVYEWDATPGDHELTVRATDADGIVQTEEQRPPAPDGASGWHTVTVTVS